MRRGDWRCPACSLPVGRRLPAQLPRRPRDAPTCWAWAAPRLLLAAVGQRHMITAATAAAAAHRAAPAAPRPPCCCSWHWPWRPPVKLLLHRRLCGAQALAGGWRAGDRHGGVVDGQAGSGSGWLWALMIGLGWRICSRACRHAARPRSHPRPPTCVPVCPCVQQAVIMSALGFICFIFFLHIVGKLRS